MLSKIVKLALRTKVQLSLLVSTIAISSVLSTAAYALPFSAISQVYFFGDSLTDSGFNNYITFLEPGKAPTFTTYGGYIWSQHVAHDIKGYALPTTYPAPPAIDTITNNTTPTNGPNGGVVVPDLTGIDYACGGSQTALTTGVGITWAPSLEQQIAHYLATAPAMLDPNAVYFIWAGANDILYQLQNGVTDQLTLLQTVNKAASNIANQIILLSKRGAKRFVVISLPSLGSTPLIMSNPNKSLPATMKTLSFTYDSMLNSQLGRVIQQYGVKVLYVDVYTLLDNIVAATNAGKPSVVAGNTFYFANATSIACVGAFNNSSLFCPNNGINNYVFADSVHPTGLAHRAISLYVESLIQSWA